MVAFSGIPLLISLLCWSCGIVTYIVSLKGGWVPECIPIIDGCTSISRSGRYGYSYFIFKAMMIPTATLLILYWIMTNTWLKTQHANGKLASRVLLSMGVTAGLCLILYSTFLGSDGDVYRFLRQVGTQLFFLFTFVGHCLLAYICFKQFGRIRVVVWQIGLCALVASQLLIFVLAKLIVDDHDWIENVIEWQSAYILSFLPVLTWALWRRTNFQIKGSTSN